MKCDVPNCQFETDHREKFAGHRSGHVRRGELAKQVIIVNVNHKCPICHLQFDDGPTLGGHLGFHQREFDDLKSDAARKRRLLMERNHQCEVCQNTSWQGQPIPIELDHMDGNPENNLKENLRLICPNCHAQTDTYKGRNIGKVVNSKRQQKMKRYVGKYR